MSVQRWLTAVAKATRCVNVSSRLGRCGQATGCAVAAEDGMRRVDVAVRALVGEERLAELRRANIARARLRRTKVAYARDCAGKVLLGRRR